MLTIDTSPKATNDIKKIVDWYEEKSDGLGKRFLEALNRKIKRLALYLHEFMFLSSTVQRAKLKKFPYTIFFSKDPQFIIILRVRHNKQLPLKRFR